VSGKTDTKIVIPA